MTVKYRIVSLIILCDIYYLGTSHIAGSILGSLFGIGVICTITVIIFICVKNAGQIKAKIHSKSTFDNISISSHKNSVQVYLLLPIPNLRGNHSIAISCSGKSIIPAKGRATYSLQNQGWQVQNLFDISIPWEFSLPTCVTHRHGQCMYMTIITHSGLLTDTNYYISLQELTHIINTLL